LAERWQTDTLDLKPDVLSILVGVNDVNNIINKEAGAAEQFEVLYKSIIDQTKSQFPDITLVICQPFVLPVGKVKANLENWQIEMGKCQAIVKHLAQKYDAIFVEFQEIMTHACRKAPAEYWMWDGIHPTVAGHELLAREWIRMVGKKIDFVK
jgi:lysophospholipase L1-like esterase